MQPLLCKKKYMKKTFLAALIVLAFGCKKTVTEIVQVPIKHSWLYDSSLFSYNKIITSSVQINDSTLACFNKQIMTFINPSQLNGSTNGAILGTTYGDLIPISLSPKIGVYPTDINTLRVFSASNPNWNYGGFLFKPTYSNSNTSTKGFPLANSGAGYPIINDKYVLAPCEIDYTNQVTKCNLIRIDTTVGIPNSIQLGTSKDIFLTPAPSTTGFSSGNYYSFGFFNKFFLTIANQFYRIDTLGNVKAFGYGPLPIPNCRVSQMFTIGNYLFAITFSDILISNDFGETWSVFASTPGFIYLVLTYQSIGNELYAFYNSQLWRVANTGSTLKYTELDNDGLATSQITGLQKVGKFAFISTLSGLYYRDTATLNTPKK